MYSWLQQEVLTKNSGWKQIKNFSKNDDMLYLRWADSLIFSADGKTELPNGCALSSSNGSIVLAPIQKRTRTKLFLHCKYLNTSVNNHILSLAHPMLTNLPILLSYLLIGFLLTFVLIPPFLRLIIRLKLGKQIRDNALVGKAEMFKLLHEHKAGTPSMGALTILASMVILILLSIIAWYFRDAIHDITGIRINNSLWSREETYLSIFTLLSM